MLKFHQNNDETSKKKMIGEKELEKYMDSEFQCLSHLPVNFGGIGDRYCQCGRKRAAYPCEFANLWYTNVSCSGRRETSSDDILKVDRNTVFLTKKNLMMNQFLEYTNSTSPPPPPQPLKNVQTEVKDEISWFYPSLPRSMLAICNVRDANSGYKNSATCSAKSDHHASIASTFCTPSSPFLDKRIVSLLRGITLYWFICLNTVLAKSELLKKKNPIALVDDINCDSATALLDAISATSSSVPPFCQALAELQLSLNLLENACDLESDILWNLFRDSFVEQSRLQKHAVIILPFDQHSKNNLLEQFVNRLVNSWLAMWRNFNQMPAPTRYCPYMIPRFNQIPDDGELHETVKDENRGDVDDQYHWPDNEIRRFDAVNPHRKFYFVTPLVSPNPDTEYISHDFVNDFGIPDPEDEPRRVVASPRRPPYEAMEVDQDPICSSVTFDHDERYESIRSTRPFDVFYGNSAGTPSNFDVPSRSVFVDRNRSFLFGNNRTPRQDARARRPASLSGRGNRIVSPVTPLYPYEHEATTPAPFEYVENSEDRFFEPAMQSPHSTMSHEALWKRIAREFGDPETNAAFANDAANTRAEDNLNSALIPADRIKVEPVESPVENISDEPDGDETAMAYENIGGPDVDESAIAYENHVDVVSDWQNDGASANDEVNYHHLENRDVKPSLRCDGEVYYSDSNSSPILDTFEQAQLEPVDYSCPSVYEPHCQNSIKEEDAPQVERLSAMASNPSAQIDPFYVPVVCQNSIKEEDVPQVEGLSTMASNPSAEIDLSNVPVVCQNSIKEEDVPQVERLSTMASDPPAQIDPSYVPVVELPLERTPKIEPCCVDVVVSSPPSTRSIATGRDNYEPFNSDYAPLPSYRASESRLADRHQHLAADSPSTRAANSNPVFDTHPSPAGTSGHSTSTNSSTWPESSTSEFPFDSPDHGGSALLGASRSTSNNSGATKEGDAPSSESDDSELIALTRAPDAHQLPPAENRYFLPQDILGGGQQECAEFNMWHWPWVNSVQLLRQESQQPQSTDGGDGEYPQYQMWNMPLVNVVSVQHSRLAHSQQPAASAASLLTSSLRSDLSINGSSEYSLWSSPKLVDVEQLSSMERQSTESDTATNPMPSHDNSCAASVQFPPFVPIIRGRVTFSDRGAFHYYCRQPPLLDSGISQPPAAPFHYAVAEPMEESEEDEEVCNLTDEDELGVSESLHSPYLFRPLAPAFKVLKDVQPPLQRSPSGREYLQNGRRLFVFEHELDAKSEDPFRFQPKYAVSLNDKGCQTEPELLYASAVANVSRSPFPHAEASHVMRPRLSPNVTAMGWSSPHQAHHWPSYQAASTSQPWPTTHFPSTSQPAPAFWAAAQPDPQMWAAEPLQYYSLNDVFSHLGQPGFANVGEYDLPLAMTYSST